MRHYNKNPILGDFNLKVLKKVHNAFYALVLWLFKSVKIKKKEFLYKTVFSFRGKENMKM